MIIDCFPFFDEFDLLEIRLNELSDIVDVFVLTEATLTFSGKPKSLYFNDNKEMFEPFLDRIEHVVVDSYEWLDGVGRRKMDWGQKQQGLNFIMDKFNPNGDDILIVSDVDEIPKAEKVKDVAADPNWTKATIVMPMFYYWFNCRMMTKIWHGGKWLRPQGKLDHRKIRYRKGDAKFKDAGWHFSFMGDIKKKLDAYCHQEYNMPPYNTPEHIEAKKSKCEDLFNRKHQYEIVEDLSYLPQYVKDNMDKFKGYFHTA